MGIIVIIVGHCNDGRAIITWLLYVTARNVFNLASYMDDRDRSSARLQPAPKETRTLTQSRPRKDENDPSKSKWKQKSRILARDCTLRDVPNIE